MKIKSPRRIFFVSTGAVLLISFFQIIGIAQAAEEKLMNGLVSGKLAACSSKPNCVSSEQDENDSHYIAPIKIKSDISMQDIKQVLLDMGASVLKETDSYIAVTFTSRFLRFVDDVEVRIDWENSLVHIRSASRTGYSDFGVNRKRVESFKVEIEKKLKA